MQGEARLVQPTVDIERVYTAEVFMKLVGSDPLWELIEGKITPVCAAAWNSGRFRHRLSTYLTAFVESRDIGYIWEAETSFRIGTAPDTVVLPDIAFARQGRLAEQHLDTYFAGSPDLAVEVRSPSDRLSDLTKKLTRYLNAGTRLTWLVDPQSVQVHVRRAGEDVGTIIRGDDVLSCPGRTSFRISGFHCG